MHRFLAAAAAGALLASFSAPGAAQLSTPATPEVGTPVVREPAGPPAPHTMASPVRSGPLPTRLRLVQALEEAAARSPTIAAAQAEVTAAEARARQAGLRTNPELSVEVENFAGTGELKGLRSTETTVSLNQRLDLGGRRSARQNAAAAELAMQRLRLAIAQADIAQGVREQFAKAVAARARLNQADETVERNRELARVAGLLVDAGREPPLRAMRARTALAQAQAEREAAEADEIGARTRLSSLLGSAVPVEAVIGPSIDLTPGKINLDRSLDARLAAAQRAAAQAEVDLQLAERRIDPALGLGVRHIKETGDVGLVAGFSMPLRVFDRNQGNIAAARASLAAAEARQTSTNVDVATRGRNAIAAVEAAERRVAALERSAIPEAEETLRLAQLSYQVGRSTLIELIDAQNALTATQTSLTDARLALALATAELGRIAAQ